MTTEERISYVKGIVDACLIFGKSEGSYDDEIDLEYNVAEKWENGAEISGTCRFDKKKTPVYVDDSGIPESYDVDYPRTEFLVCISDISDVSNCCRQVMNHLEQATDAYFSNIYKREKNRLV